MYIKDLSKLVGPLYSKVSAKGQKYFNKEDIYLVQKIKEECKKVPKLHLLLDSDYKIVQTGGSQLGWGGVLLAKDNQYSIEERICRYASGKYKSKDKLLSSIDYEIFAVIEALWQVDKIVSKERQPIVLTMINCISLGYANLNSSLTTKRQKEKEILL